MTAFFLVLAVVSPLAALLALAPRPWRGATMRASPLAALPALLLALAGPTGARIGLPWLLQHTVLELDTVARVFLGFTSALWLAAAWYGQSYLAKDAHPVRYHVFFFGAMAGNFALILAGDIPTFYLGFALMGFASAGLVFHRGDVAAERAGRLYLALAIVGEVVIFTGLVFLVATGGTSVIAELPAGAFRRIPLLLLLVGFGVKAGALTLHFWLPLAHPAAPVPASAVLSGAMIKAGLLGWLRFLPLGELSLPWVGYAMIGAGMGAAFLGTFVGVAQRNPKTVLAYSSISQMGIIMAGVGIGAMRPESWPEILAAVLIYTTHHALAKGSLFLSVGPLETAHTARLVRWARLGVLVPALALTGAPLTSGALAKTALKSNVAFLPGAWPQWLGILLPLAAVGTSLKMARFLWLTWPRRPAPETAHAHAMWPPWLFTVGAVIGGVWLLPGAIGAMAAKLSWEKLWEAFWPLAAGALLGLLGAWLRRRFTVDFERWLPAGDVGVVLERLLERRGRGRARDAGTRGPDVGEAPSPETRWPGWLERLARGAPQVEEILRVFTIGGVLLVVVVAIVLGCLWK